MSETLANVKEKARAEEEEGAPSRITKITLTSQKVSVILWFCEMQCTLCAAASLIPPKLPQLPQNSEIPSYWKIFSIQCPLPYLKA